MNFFADARIPAVLLVLSTVLIPVKAASGFKPTIATAQADTVLFETNINQAQENYHQAVVDSEQNGNPIFPKLVVFAEHVSSPNNGCMVVYKHLQYKLNNISRGVDVFHKLTTVLKIPVSKISKLVWIFIGHYFYGIPNKNTYRNIEKLFEFLKKEQQCPSSVP